MTRPFAMLPSVDKPRLTSMDNQSGPQSLSVDRDAYSQPADMVRVLSSTTLSLRGSYV